MVEGGSSSSSTYVIARPPKHRPWKTRPPVKNTHLRDEAQDILGLLLPAPQHVPDGYPVTQHIFQDEHL